LPSASEVDGGAEWCDQTSTMSKLVKMLQFTLTGAAEEDIEEYRPVSCYHSPGDWGQVTSPVTEPLVWTLNGEWNEAASAQQNKSTLSSWRGNSSTCLSQDEFLGVGLQPTASQSHYRLGAELLAVGEVDDLQLTRGFQSSLHLVGDNLNASTQWHHYARVFGIQGFLCTASWRKFTYLLNIVLWNSKV